MPPTTENLAFDRGAFEAAILDVMSPYLALSAAQLGLLASHCELLLRWSQRMNLTAVRDLREIVVRHYCESLFFAAAIPWKVASVGDIGSGAGFPGVGVAAVYPDVVVTLVESNVRKGVFLKESTRNFANVNVEAERAENISERFDLITSRAVAPDVVVALMPKLSSRVGLLVSERTRLDRSFTWNVVNVPFVPGHACAFAETVPRGT